MHQFAELAHCRHLQGKLQTILYLKCTSVCTYFSAFIFASDVFAVSANIPWDVKTSICTQMSQWQKIDAQQQKKLMSNRVLSGKNSSYVFWAVNRTQNLAMPSVTFTEWT